MKLFYKITIIIGIIIFLILFLLLSREYFVPFEALTSYKDIKNINDLFKKIIILLERHNITYWIQGGTLLGSVRNKGIIPWDDDIDISILEDDIIKLRNLKEELNEMDLDITDSFFGYKIYDKNGTNIKGHETFKFPFIDIFVTKKYNTIIKYVSKQALDIWKNDYFTLDELYPLKKYQFEDYEVYGPNNPYNYLDRLYPDWKIKAIKTYDHITHTGIDKLEFNIEYSESNKPYLWQYWEGPMPSYIKLCLDTVDKHCSNNFTILRLNESNIREYLPELEKYEDKLSQLIIAHKVDIYRIMLLYKYGGIYLDVDIIVLRNPLEIIEKLRKYDFVGFGCTGNKCKNGYGKPSNWLLASKPNTILMANILKNLLHKLTKLGKLYKPKIEYHDFGKLVIWEELDKLIKDGYTYYHYPNTIDGTRDVDGLWVDSSRIFSNENIKYDNEENMMFLILYNSEIDDSIKQLSENELLNKNWSYSKFIKKSLEL